MSFKRLGEKKAPSPEATPAPDAGAPVAPTSPGPGMGESRAEILERAINGANKRVSLGSTATEATPAPAAADGAKSSDHPSWGGLSSYEREDPVNDNRIRDMRDISSLSLRLSLSEQRAQSYLEEKWELTAKLSSLEAQIDKLAAPALLEENDRFFFKGRLLDSEQKRLALEAQIAVLQSTLCDTTARADQSEREAEECRQQLALARVETERVGRAYEAAAKRAERADAQRVEAETHLKRCVENARASQAQLEVERSQVSHLHGQYLDADLEKKRLQRLVETLTMDLERTKKRVTEAESALDEKTSEALLLRTEIEQTVESHKGVKALWAQTEFERQRAEISTPSPRKPKEEKAPPETPGSTGKKKGKRTSMPNKT